MSAGQATGFSLQVAVIGMVIVFTALIVLIFLFKIMSFLVSRGKGKKDIPAPAWKEAAPLPVPPVAAPIERAALEDEADEIAAVIANTRKGD